jgi:uncharacterized protein (DUF2126 family)
VSRPDPHDPLDGEVQAHDRAVAEQRLPLWIGAEPTFTDASSQDPWWLGQAEGGDKEERARALLDHLAPHLGDGVEVLRAEGRQFPDEPRPRFAHAARWTRPEGHGWLTVTPDPGVVEVNMAPSADLAGFRAQARSVYAAAARVGLSPSRFRYNGQEVDSGGGGQLTFGGPTPTASPLLTHPWMLAGLVRYLNRHPALSYLFAGECVGSASQGPRPDESVAERFQELEVALEWLARRWSRREPVPPAELWESLARVLCDGAGNSHRSEVNIEKLWNPYLAERGCLGLCELRALRMPSTPEKLVAVAALFRALLVRVGALAPPGYAEPLIDHGADLHDRLALPTLLLADLRDVLAELAVHGMGLGPTLTALLTEPVAPLAVVTCGPARLTLTPALEFWPLLGDVASQERSGSRLVDSSSARVEVRVEVPEGHLPGVVAVGHGPRFGLPLRPLGDGVTWLAAVRYRSFKPGPGLHPGLPAHDPLTLTWTSPHGPGVQVLVHSWRPGGGAYAGLPVDAAEARLRRDERVRIQELGGPVDPPVRPLPDELAGTARWTLDLRRLA